MNNNEDNLQYFHNIEEKFTVCCEVPSKQEFMIHLGMALTFDKSVIPFKIGIAKCHPKDKYVRKLGKEISSQNLQEIEFHLDQIRVIDKNLYVVYLMTKVEDVVMSVEMEVSKNISRVYFVNFKHF